MRILSRRDIEAISRKVLLQYLKTCKETPTWIDPEDFGKQMLGIEFDYKELCAAKDQVGITVFGSVELNFYYPGGVKESFQTNENIAIVDPFLLKVGNEGPLHYTMMHELAHRLLQLLFPKEYYFEGPDTRIYYSRSSRPHTGPVVDWLEWQSNVLASCLLLPRELIYKYMKQLELGDCIHLLNRVFAPREYERFSEMAYILGVSKTALSIRLSQLGLIGRNDLFNPYALVDVYPDDHEVA